ncbi:NfeD family protein [Paenibacillus sp.]|jgi:membrane protein implicated in regulation of membrane protease activity|uniref:NfeD family protein n=1 Tax=Paenibacillus sp. TaxID=58172 RepID=UPI002830E949|nr:NfeD family protein [Paenibacillus sp.]MDR0270230.1 protease [Paenibacillus sp.]
METLFWSCLAGGILFAVVSVILGDLVSHALDGLLDFLSVDFLKPMVIASAVTVFGGAGILLSHYTDWGGIVIIVLSVVLAMVIAALVYFFYVKPMNNSENSTGYSMRELSGRIGEVTIPIPDTGFGEVMIKLGAGNTLHIASSLERHQLSAGTRVVVVDVLDGVLRVTKLDERKGDVV